MNQFRSTVAEPWLPERRLHDRRHIQNAEHIHPGWILNRHVLLPILLIGFSILAWQWRYAVYAPIWLARAHWADRSDLYLGRTNANSNEALVMQVRNYLTDIDRLDAAGNVTAPEVLRPLGVHLDFAWFRRHVPDSVDFNPFISPGGKFVVTWLYYPGCQKTVWKSPRTDTDWYSLRGRPCFPDCRLSVLMDPDLKLTSIVLQTLRQG